MEEKGEPVKIKRSLRWLWWVAGVIISVLFLGFSVVYYLNGKIIEELVIQTEPGRGSGFTGFGEEIVVPSLAPETAESEEEESCLGMSEAQAREIAQKSECVSEGNLKEEAFCNENSRTWWIEMEADKPGCNPACVIWVETGEAEVNWRCTGLSN